MLNGIKGAGAGAVAGAKGTLQLITNNLWTQNFWFNVGLNATFNAFTSGSYTTNQIRNNATAYFSTWKNKSAAQISYDIVYGIGYGGEKVAETALLTRGTGALVEVGAVDATVVSATEGGANQSVFYQNNRRGCYLCDAE